MFEDYKEKQSLLYNYIKTSVKNNRISHAYLIEDNGVSYGFDLAISLARFFLCNDGLSECNIDITNYPDIRIIDSHSKTIKKEELLDLQKSFSNKPLYGKYLIYIIKDVQFFNKSSANTILKFLEEPNDDIIAILLTHNIYSVIDTIVSRCQILSLTCDNDIISDFDDVDLEAIIDMYCFLQEHGVISLLGNNIYSYRDNFDIFLKVGLYLYFDILNYLLGRNIIYFVAYEEKIKNIVKICEVDDIIRRISVVNKFIGDISYNVNKELFIDNFLISVGGNLDD